MVFFGFTGGRREKRSPNYLYVKNPFTGKRELKRERKEAAREKNREKEQRERRHNESEFLNTFFSTHFLVWFRDFYLICLVLGCSLYLSSVVNTIIIRTYITEI